jgi:transcriptional regulator with XRE-family HTH domain
MGNRIRENREKRGLSLEEVADRAGISPGYLSRMETERRNVSLKNVAKLATALNVRQGDLLDTQRTVDVVGYAAAGADTVTFAEGQGPFDEVEAPSWANETTVAVRVRGTSLGLYFDGWLAFYDRRRDPPDDSLVDALCVCGLSRGRVVIKKLRAGSAKGLFHLESETEPTLFDERVEWAAEVKEMRPR